MSTRYAWTRHTIPQVPHVVGFYTEVEEDETPRWVAWCMHCLTQHGPLFCLRGKPKDRIRDFAAVHGHGLHDPNAPPST